MTHYLEWYKRINARMRWESESRHHPVEAEVYVVEPSAVDFGGEAARDSDKKVAAEEGSSSFPQHASPLPLG